MAWKKLNKQNVVVSLQPDSTAASDPGLEPTPVIGEEPMSTDGDILSDGED